uniref:ANF_receptor domain-containing protein n=1 Tax=Steinernema glaseri TaxID=37863 RepID=A0A1I7XWN1_9BILA
MIPSILGVLCVVASVQSWPAKIPIQSYTMPGDREQGVIATFNFTVERHNNNRMNPFKFAYRNRDMRTSSADTWGVTKKLCDDLQSGFMMMIAGETSRLHSAFLGVADHLEIPFINWDLSPIVLQDIGSNSMEVSMRPPTAELLADLIIQKNWNYVIYMHDGRNSAQNVHQIYNFIQQKSNLSVRCEIVRIPRDPSDFGEYLQKFNLQRFLTNEPKRIIIDVQTSYRQQQFLAAIRAAQFNQHHYHYVVANYVSFRVMS